MERHRELRQIEGTAGHSSLIIPEAPSMKYMGGKNHRQCFSGCFYPSLFPPPFSWSVLPSSYRLSACMMRCTCIIKLVLATLVRKYTLGKGNRETFRSQCVVFLNNMAPKEGTQEIAGFHGQASVLT